MHVRHLRLIDFRSYSSVDVELTTGVNVFVGPNGQGKTNLVEAIGYVATLGSHRVATDAPLIRSGASRAQIRTAVVSDDRELVIEISLIPGKSNQVTLNRSPVARPRSILGALRTVLFAPEDLSLVRGDPSERRRFIDDLVVARWPRFAGIRADYDRVLKQRNALLKSAGFSQRRRGGARGGDESSTDLRTLEVWDTHVAQYGSQLLAGRIATVAALAPHVEKAYRTVSDSVSLASIKYQSSLSEFDTEPAEPLAGDPDVLNARLLAALAQARSRELERGITLVGPHRDELLLKLGELPAKGYASHGESWSFALALRLACFELLRAEGIEPVLILDDVFAELDTARRERLGELVAQGSQVLVTAAVAADLPRSLSAEDPTGARFDVAESRVRRVC